MSFYKDRIVPHLVNLAMRQAPLAAYRQRVVPHAEGRVLEVGVGSGLNFPFYGMATRSVVGLEPSAKLIAMAEESARKGATRIELLAGTAESTPLEDESVDTVLTMWTLCTIPDVHRALAEMRRVLKPTGRLLFVEHGRSPDAGVRRWQDWLTPAWVRIAGGCHLTRPIQELIEHAGFRIERLDTAYMQGPKAMTFTYESSARPQ